MNRRVFMMAGFVVLAVATVMVFPLAEQATDTTTPRPPWRDEQGIYTNIREPDAESAARQPTHPRDERR